jgi:hypothetical protein
LFLIRFSCSCSSYCAMAFAICSSFSLTHSLQNLWDMAVRLC